MSHDIIVNIYADGRSGGVSFAGDRHDGRAVNWIAWVNNDPRCLANCAVQARVDVVDPQNRPVDKVEFRMVKMDGSAAECLVFTVTPPGLGSHRWTADWEGCTGCGDTQFKVFARAYHMSDFKQEISGNTNVCPRHNLDAATAKQIEDFVQRAKARRREVDEEIRKRWHQLIAGGGGGK